MKSYLPYLKWILLILGAARFRTFGAFVGFFIGVFIEEYFTDRKSLFGEKKPTYQLTPYQKSFIVLIVPVLRTFNYISKNQRHFILKYFYRKFGTNTGKAMYRKLQALVQIDQDYQSVAQSMQEMPYANKISILQFLLDLASQNSRLKKTAANVVRDIAANMKVAKNDVEQLIKKLVYHQKSQQKSTTIPTSSFSIAHYCKILGVDLQDSEATIKKAYRKLVRLYHPDTTELNPQQAALQFQKVQEAYDKVRAYKGIK